MTFLHQFSLLWLLAWAALAFFGLSVCWLIISSLWQLSRKNVVFSEKTLIPSKPGELEPYATLPRKLTATQIAKTMLLAAAILGAYDLGTKINYSREYAAWKAYNADYEKTYAAWAARQPKKETK